MTLHLDSPGEISSDSAKAAESLSEATLLNLLARNLDDYFVFVVLKYDDRVQQSIKQYGLCYDDVQEVKHVAFHNAYFAMKDYSEDDFRLIRSLPGYLCEIARNSALNIKNKKGKNISYERTFEAHEQEDRVLKGPEERAIEAEYLRTVYEYINLLPKKYGELLKCLATYEGVSYFDLAQMQGLPVGTVKSRVATARKLLRQVMREEQMKREDK